MHSNHLIFFVVISLLPIYEAYPYPYPFYPIVEEGGPMMGPPGPPMGPPGPPMGPGPMVEPQMGPPPVMRPYGSQNQILQDELEGEAIGGLLGEVIGSL